MTISPIGVEDCLRLKAKAALVVLLAALLVGTAACRSESAAGEGWTLMTQFPTARGELAAAVAGERLYVLGGLSGAGGSTDRVEVYDFATGEWQTAAPLPRPLNHLAAAALDERVYVFGGSTSFGSPALATAQVYDPAADAWTPIADMPEGRWAAGAAAVDGKLYVLGGVGGRNNAIVLIYDPQTGAWSEGAPMPTPREHLAVVAFEGRVYAMGGRSDQGNLNAVEIYDPAANTWQTAAPLPTARSGLAAAAAGGRIVVAGGENPSATQGKVFPEVEVYDPAADRWSSAPPLPTPRHGLAAAGHGDLALFVGGSGRQGALSATAWSDVVEAYSP